MAVSRRRMMADAVKKIDYDSLDPALRDKIFQHLQTPAGFAYLASQGKWMPSRHLIFISDLLVKVAKGSITRLILNLPPRHGKTEIVKHFITWFLAFWRSSSVVYAAHTADFASKIGGEIRDITKDGGKRFFGMEIRDDTDAAFRWNLAGQKSSFFAAGMRGPLMGRGADLFVIDDPVKDEEEALSETVQEKNFEWFKSAAVSRLEPGGRFILIQHRWSINDLAGKLIHEMEQGGDKWVVVRLPAIAEENDMLGRMPGESLWPERWPLPLMLAKKAATDARWWGSLYQQNPVPESGGMFIPDWFDNSIFVDAPPREGDVVRRVRSWDEAATFKAGCFTAGVRMSKTRDGIFYIEDVVREQLDVHRRDRLIQFTAHQDRAECPRAEPMQVVEEEGGSAGKTAAAHWYRLLEGFSALSKKVSGSKETRAAPYASQFKAGNIRIVRRPWNRAFIDEHLTFPESYCDQVDAASLAFSILREGMDAQVKHEPIVGFGKNVMDRPFVRDFFS